jgi:spermidine/putrescine ABC transporter ATP-binding subunit
MSEDIKLDGVKKRFGDVKAVNGIDLSVEEGTFLTLLGPSGCGKTTTLRMIAGFEEPTEGSVIIDGEDVSSTPPYDRPTSMVFQNFALFPHKSVGENVAFGLKMRGVDAETRERRAAEMLEMVELGGYEDRRIDELSGGQQQRVALARALITEPTVLLLDEPLGALDLQLRRNMQIELKNLQTELGTTFVYVTHDQEEALTMSDQIAVMNDGRLEQLGTPTEIYEHPETEFVADFIGDTNLLEGKYVEADGARKVSTGDIEIPVESNGKFADGDSVSVSIRPEKIHFGDGGTEFSGTVEDVIYQGNIAKIHVTVGGRELVVEKHVDQTDGIPQVGDDVGLTWESDQVDVLGSA